MIGSAPGSAGDGNMEEEAEGSVLRWRSSVKEKNIHSQDQNHIILTNTTG